MHSTLLAVTQYGYDRQGHYATERRTLNLRLKPQRYYDTETGQYLTPDPIGLAGGVNPYGYVHNPLRWVDPLGLACCPLKFSDQDKLTSHFQKHGGEFGAKSEQEYLQIGQDLIKNGIKFNTCTKVN